MYRKQCAVHGLVMCTADEKWIYNCKLYWKEMYRTLLGVSKEFVHIVKAMEQRESTAPCSLRDLVSIGRCAP